MENTERSAVSTIWFEPLPHKGTAELIPLSPLRLNNQMRKAVKVLDFHGFFVFVHATRNVKKRIISFQKRDPFLEKGKKGHAKADKSH